MADTESSALARLGIGVAVLACYVGAVVLWVHGARDAFSDCDARSCETFGLNLAKAVAFDYAENRPEAIFFGLFIFCVLGGCIVATLARATVTATASSARATLSVLFRASDGEFTAISSVVVLSALLGIYYGAQRSIPAECCPQHDRGVPVTMALAFVLAAVPGAVVVGAAVCRARRSREPAPDDSDFSVQLLNVT